LAVNNQGEANLENLYSFLNESDHQPEPFTSIDKHKWIDATGDVVSGDVIKFSEAVFSGSYKNAKFEGNRIIVAKIIKDSYGSEKQQHTFTIQILDSSGFKPLSIGTKTTRKGRNIYRNKVERMLWKDESQRDKAADEKHGRGDIARALRSRRIQGRDR
jgi:hypothetical protein